MKGEDIYYSLGYISEELIQEAYETTGKLRNNQWKWKHLTAMAGSILLLGVSLFVFQNGGSDNSFNESSTSGSSGSSGTADGNILVPETEGTEEEKEYVLQLNQLAESVAKVEVLPESYFIEDLEEGEIQTAFPYVSEWSNMINITGQIGYFTQGDVVIFYDGNVEVVLEQDRRVKIQFAKEELDTSYVVEGEEVLSEIQGVSVMVGCMETRNNGYLYYAEFMLENISYQVEMTSSDEAESLFTELVVDLILGSGIDASLF